VYGTWSSGVNSLLNNPYTDPKKFGYYSVKDQLFFSKIEAMECSLRNNCPISYHYNDDAFLSADWTVEPTKSLSELYQQRAQQIRDQYDHIVLFYSGGADSHNMLESFVSAGIKIDEIASFHSYAADGDQSSSFNREIFETAIPYVEKLKAQQLLDINTPHRLIDMSDIIVKFSQDINWLDFPYMANSSVSINNVARAFLRKYIVEWRDLIDSGKRVCLVWGHDKPRIMHDQKFYLQFLDIFDNCVSTINQQTATPGYFDELFYSTPDLPELVIKQAHTIKNFLETATAEHPFLTEHVTGLGHVVKHYPDKTCKSLWLTQDAQSYLLYPWFKPELYYEPKPKDIINSKRDRWFWQDQFISQKFTTVVTGLATQFGETWLNINPGSRATKNYRSARYYIG